MKNASKKLWAIALALCLTLPLTLASCEGEPGPQGEPGIQGEKGEPGETGAQGEKGDKGDTGAQGEKGDKGDTGAQGEKGDKGDTGAQGEKGDKGDTGAQGEKGDKGDTGAQGEKGDKGDTGAQGEKGDKGDTGAQGEKGDKGDTGAQGEKGDKGDTGAQGEKGDKGETGAQGETGNGIASVKLTATDGLIDTYTVTFTDGTKTTFTVVNGADGVQGEQGEKGDVGADGKNAYELYCEQFGYEGTLEEWLEIISSEIFKEYTVVFDLNGGTGTEDFVRKVAVRSGHSVALTIPERTGYNFLGWFIGEGVNEAKFDADDRVSHNMTLKAKWGIKTSTVTFLDYYEDVISTETVNWGEAATAPVAPTVTGYYFLKWDKAYDNITANTTVKALYAPVTYTVSFNTNGGSEVAAQEVYVGQSPMRPAEPYKYGHYFIGWYTDEACTVSYNFNKAFEGDTTVYALFKESKPIYTVQDLKNIANDVWGKYYLANDIDLEGEAWEPIGDFYGTLDGEGHKICNFSMATTSSGNFGFFATNQGTIKNVTLCDFIYSSNCRNGIFGVLVASNHGTIENCTVTDGAISATAAYHGYDAVYDYHLGGIVGDNYGAVKNCSVDVAIQGKADVYNSYDWSTNYSAELGIHIGGIVAHNMGDISECISSFNVEYVAHANAYAGKPAWVRSFIGGIVGENSSDGNISDSATLADSTLTLSATGNQIRLIYAGLGVGNNLGGTILNCYAAGNIVDNGTFNSNCILGGFVGHNSGTVNGCYANTEITSVSTGGSIHSTGGFAGYNSKTIINCYSTGSVSAAGDTGIGGFIGKNETGGSISKCFSTTNVDASINSNVNYFAGATADGSTTFKCFYGANVTIKTYGYEYTPEEPAATSKTEIELYSEEFLCDTLSWKKDVWNITGTGLPTLVWEGE